MLEHILIGIANGFVGGYIIGRIVGNGKDQERLLIERDISKRMEGLRPIKPPPAPPKGGSGVPPLNIKGELVIIRKHDIRRAN